MGIWFSVVYKIRTHTYTHAGTHKHTPLPHGDKEPPLFYAVWRTDCSLFSNSITRRTRHPPHKGAAFFHFLPKYVVFARMGFRSTLLMYIAVLQYIGVPSVDEGPATRRGRKARPARRVTSSHSLWRHTLPVNLEPLHPWCLLPPDVVLIPR